MSNNQLSSAKHHVSTNSSKTPPTALPSKRPRINEPSNTPTITAATNASTATKGNKVRKVAVAVAAPAAATVAPPNIYDAMLGEISDLLSAAQESQACGRLKMASTYQLLVHARLVGLGKRFDRFLANQEIKKVTPPISSSATSATTAGTTGKNGTKNSRSSPGDSIRTAQAALAKILPSEVNLDNTMMEHLARAAMELHNRRTGRGMLHERELERKHLAREANELRMMNKSGNKNLGAQEGADNGIAWSVSEKQKCRQALEKFGMEDVGKIAKAVGTRTEAEVRAHLMNIDERKRVERGLDLAASKKGSEGVGVSGGLQGDNEKDSRESNTAGGTAGVEGTPEKRKGRGKKPPPRAMLTVPNSSFDAKKIIYEPI